MTKVIVIEGADGTGKTTMAKHIAQDNGWDYIKTGQPRDREDAMGTIILQLQDLKRHKGVVFDRAWLGEIVYGAMFRHYDVDTDFMGYIQEKLIGHDVLYVLTRASHAWAVAHAKHDLKGGVFSNKNLVLNQKNYDEIQERFVSALGKVSMGEKFVFNQENYANQEIALEWASLIVNRWRNGFQMYDKCDPMYALTCWNWKERFVNGDMQTNATCSCGHFKDHMLYPFWKRRSSITWGVGNVKDPLFIMIGEAPGMNGCGTTGIPFYFDRSGFFLRQLLYEHGVAETEYYITNISKCTTKDNAINYEYAAVDASRNLALELKALPKDRVIIALGRTAQNWLQEHYPDRDVRFIYHPAYVLRGGMSEDQYREEFTRLMESVGVQ